MMWFFWLIFRYIEFIIINITAIIVVLLKKQLTYVLLSCIFEELEILIHPFRHMFYIVVT